MYYPSSLSPQCTDRVERDRLILFLNRLILHKRNVKEIMDANGVKTLVDLLTVAHLHTTRAVVPMQVINLIFIKKGALTTGLKSWMYAGNCSQSFREGVL